MKPETLNAAERALEDAAKRISEHFELTDSTRQSIADRRELKRILTTAREHVVPVRESVTVGQPEGRASEVLSAYDHLRRDVEGRLREAEVYVDSREFTGQVSDLQI